MGGYVHDYGGGTFTVMVDRDTEIYPSAGLTCATVIGMTVAELREVLTIAEQAKALEVMHPTPIDEGSTTAYKNGWNRCRATVLDSNELNGGES